MDIKEKSRKEYIARINNVTNYIDNNITSPINLSILAEKANFSPFHFHRTFTLLVGETPNSYLQRVRLEIAASMLLNNKEIPISDIAYSCGFNSASLFSRNFKSHFGITAKEFRLQEKPIFVHKGVRYSKNGKLISKIDKLDFDYDSELCSVKLKEIIFMDAKIEIKEMPELQVVYVRHMGRYDQISNAYEKLMKWAGPRGLLRFPETKVLTVYNDDPAVTSIENVRQDACITVTEDVKVEGEIGKETINGGRYAVGHFEVDATGFEKAWNTMCLWLTESGYQFCGKPYELYHNDHTLHPEKKFIVDICIPVMPL